MAMTRRMVMTAVVVVREGGGLPLPVTIIETAIGGLSREVAASVASSAKVTQMMTSISANPNPA